MIRARSALLFLSLLLVTAGGAGAYVIVFKDGSTLVARERFETDGDLARTEEKNEMELGRALVIDTTAPREPGAAQRQEQTLADVARGLRAQDFAAGANAGRDEQPLRRTPAGNVDFFAIHREPYEPPDRAAAIRDSLDKVGLAGAIVRQGSAEGRVLVDVVTATRGEVLDALQDSARAFLEISSAHPEIEALELAMATPNRSRAGQFVLTTEDAADLADGTVSPQEYFLAKVLF